MTATNIFWVIALFAVVALGNLPHQQTQVTHTQFVDSTI
jgi:hypothetical protein